MHIELILKQPKIARRKPPASIPLTLTTYPTATLGLSAKDVSIISCSHLMTESSVLAGWKNLKGVETTSSVEG